MASAVTAAQQALNQAKSQLATAQSALQSAETKLAAAKAALESQAKKYGDRVVIITTNVTAGEVVPEPQLGNALTLRTAAPNHTMVVLAASVDGNSTPAQLPAGTKAEWLNPSKVAADAQVPGDYMEDVLVTFPDGSFLTKQGELKVAAKPATEPSKDNNSTVNGNNGNGSTTSNNGAEQAKDGGYAGNNGIFTGKNNAQVEFTKSTANATTNENVTMPTREQYKQSLQNQSQNTLPQTGNDSQNIVATLGLALLGITAGLLGIRKVD